MPHYLNLYVPTFFLVSISWISFWIDPANVPGRMGILITLFLVNIRKKASFPLEIELL